MRLRVTSWRDAYSGFEAVHDVSTVYATRGREGVAIVLAGGFTETRLETCSPRLLDTMAEAIRHAKQFMDNDASDTAPAPVPQRIRITIGRVLPAQILVETYQDVAREILSLINRYINENKEQLARKPGALTAAIIIKMIITETMWPPTLEEIMHVINEG